MLAVWSEAVMIPRAIRVKAHNAFAVRFPNSNIGPFRPFRYSLGVQGYTTVPRGLRSTSLNFAQLGRIP
jgi:hypothetical protein